MTQSKWHECPIKRLFDCTAALTGLVLAAPIIGLLVIAIRHDSKGSAIFAQERVGKAGRIFLCYKLRTMQVETANVPTHLADASRITRLGAILRRTKLDELPQLWNIVRGEMSFVGPRPCLPSQVELVEERRRRGILTLLPGITGPAQVESIDMSDPVRLATKDAEYLRNSSFMIDLQLIWRTVVGGAGRGDRIKAPRA